MAAPERTGSSVLSQIMKPNGTAEASNTNNASIRVDQRKSRSIANATLQLLIKSISPIILKLGPPQPPGSPRLTPHKSAQDLCPIVETQLENIWIYTFINDSAGIALPKTTQAILLCWRVFKTLRLKNIGCYIRSLPTIQLRNPFRICGDFTRHWSLEKKKEGRWITLMGDSAGANIALTLDIYAATMFLNSSVEGCSVLRNVLAICPPTDLRNQIPGIDSIAHKDPVLSRKIIEDAASAWLGDWSRSDPQLSPIFADLGALKHANIKVDGIIAGHDALTPDAILFREHLADVRAVRN
ncbi:hypothetical protein G7Y89_g6749 [Cudoniella acicularis]|uniref:Alpha/beta hydrolase fold-3 domain-containing protein n=1 Tax=Cudoniella acicularis TaxID=354080 RepID=A0A8H4RLN8_9HELO|nr:hypothetical protein G7Y89_g6749 [Cudoniella acicularis]